MLEPGIKFQWWAIGPGNIPDAVVMAAHRGNLGVLEQWVREHGGRMAVPDQSPMESPSEPERT